MSQRLDGDLYLSGRFVPGHMSYPANELDDAAVAAGADIKADKLEHQHQKSYSQANSAAADETRVLHVVHGATGVIDEFEAGNIVKAIGDATCTVDLRKNGTTVLDSPITLNSSSANYTPQAGTITVPALVAGDVLTVVIDGTIGTGTLPTGVYCSLKLQEKAD